MGPFEAQSETFRTRDDSERDLGTIVLRYEKDFSGINKVFRPLMGHLRTQ